MTLHHFLVQRDMLKAYRVWLSTLDPEQLGAMASAKAWSVTIALGVVGLCVAGFVPIVSNFFELEFFKSVICLMVVMPFAALETHPWMKQHLRVEWYGVVRLLTAMVFQFFMWSLVCLTSLPGSAVMASFPILLASYHGQAFLVSFRFWYGGLATIGALMGAWWITDNPSHHAILMLGGMMALGSAIIMGGVAQQRVAAMRERDALKQAVDAQILLDRSREAEAASQLVKDIRGTNHDAGNALSGLLVNLDYLVMKTSAHTIDEKTCAMVKEVAVDLKDGVQTLKQLIEQGRDMKPRQTVDEAIDVLQALTGIQNDVARSHNHVQINVHEPPRMVELHMVGGELSFTRVFTNLVLNAIEGNGHSGATIIDISLMVLDEQWLKLVVEDNGPGFSELQLERGLESMRQVGLETTKTSGSGLGIYTTCRLIEASQGHVRFENREAGGAKVSVFLPLYAQGNVSASDPLLSASA